MSASENIAVFLSYASQDAAAVRRIAEALRAAGVEVWFDQNELVGGDAWDQKIRAQIKSCALFVPVISAATQARREGYFRLEWKLAAQRTHMISERQAFLLPVVIDGTSDAAADVPEEFRAVQWTRLPGGEGAAVEKFCARVGRLLGGDAVAAVPGAGARPGRTREDGRGPAPLRKLAPGAIGVAVLVGAAVAIWPPWKNSAPAGPMKPEASSNPAGAPQIGASAAAQLAEQAYRLTQKVSLTRDDLDAADGLARRAAELEPQSPRVWAVRAWVEAAYVERRFDSGGKHLPEAQTVAKRALALNTNDADAMNALAQVMLAQNAQAEAEKLLREAVKVAPGNSRSRILLANVVLARGRAEEGRSLLVEAVRRNPQDVAARFALALNYTPWQEGSPSSADVTAALEQLDAALALQPFEAGFVLKAWVVATRRGDLATMRATLDELEKLPLAQRATDRAIFVALMGGLFERRLDRVLASAALTTRPFLQDTLVALPRVLFVAIAYKIAGKANLAQQHFLLAEAAQRDHDRDDPGDALNNAGRLAFIMAQSGQRDAAVRTLGPVEAAWREDMNPYRARILARAYGAVGDATKAAPYLEMVLNASNITTDHALLLDPWWDPVRGQPAFEAIVAKARQRIADAGGPETKSPGSATAPAPDEKSVAVLAFANLSDDKANEYFSDGISEELLNVLGRVPGLRVAAPMSAFSFKGKNVPAQEIGQKLNVAFLVNGSVRRAGPEIRVVARLSRADTDEQIWTEKFNGEAKNVFALQDEIAGKIAAALSLKLGASARAAKPIDPEAYRLYLEGRQFWSARSLDALDRAEVAFKGALQLEPESALIHAGLAELYGTRALYRALAALPEAGDLNRASEQADRAVALDPKLVQGYVARATIAVARQNYPEAERLLRDSLALAPNDALALNRLGDVMISAGRLDAGLEYYQRALQLDPLSAFMVRDVVRESIYAHRFQEAIEVQQRFDAATPQDTWSAVGVCHAQIQLGLAEQARAKLKASLPNFTPESYPGPGIVEWVFVLREAKLEAESEALAKQLLAHYGPDTYIHALVLMARGRTEEALPLLKPFPPGSQDRLYWSPMFDPVRDDSRFLRKVEELGVAAEYKIARETLARMLKEQIVKK